MREYCLSDIGVKYRSQRRNRHLAVAAGEISRCEYYRFGLAARPYRVDEDAGAPSTLYSLSISADLFRAMGAAYILYFSLPTPSHRE